MKKITLIGLVCLITMTSFAQNSAVNKANAYIQGGADAESKDIAEAKKLIDQAIVHEKTKEKGRTWYVRGLVYSLIVSSEDESIHALDEDAIAKANESFKKVEEIEKEGSNYYTLTEIQLSQLYSNVFNKGAAKYQAEEYMVAYKYFNEMTLLSPTDTLGYMYAGYCAEAAEEYDLALKQYFAVMELEDCPVMIYNQSLVILEQNKDDLEGALEVANKAMARFPDDQTFDKTQIALFIKLDRTDEARYALEEALKAEPENANLWYNLGYLNGEVGNFDKSVDSYMKSIDSDPSYLDSYINLAYSYTEKAKEIRKEAMDMDIKTYQERGAPIEAKADEYYKLALPVLEKANELEPDDQAVLESLNGLYLRLKMKDKEKAIADQLIALGYWDE